MAMKKILITGGTSGIGLEIARILGKQGHHLLITGRNPEKLAQVKAELSGVNLITYEADFSRLEQVWKLAERLCAEHEYIDVVINNAGGANGKRTLTPDGFELTLAVNHLAPFLLTHLLLPLLEKSVQGRIINLASSAHYHGKIYKEDLQLSKGYFILKAYAQSKLANVMFTLDLAEKLKDTNITVHAVHPGVVKTKIGQKNALGYMGLVWQWITLLKGISVTEGADNSVWLATTEDTRALHGKYFHKRKSVRPAPQAMDLETRQWLWKESVYLTGLPKDC